MWRILIIVLILCLLDCYVFRTFQNQFSTFPGSIKYSIYSVFWLIPLLLSLLVVLFIYSNSSINNRPEKLVFYIASGFVLFYLPKLFVVSFQVIEDLSKILAWLVKKFSEIDGEIYLKAEKISKSVIIGRIGLIIAVIPFFSIIYGITYGRYKFEVKNVILYFDHLPSAFDGFKIVQFSDFHSGSLNGNQDKYKKAFDLINQQQADIIVFTGDIVNNNSNEIAGWVEILSRLKAKQGKYSILGNHDYGDYFRWKNEDLKKANLEQLKIYHKEMGFRLLMNEAIVIERDSQSIALLGVENWGEKPFPQHGKLNLALEESKGTPFKILLSHDPTHWEHEVRGKTDIALTLSGHTHGMQLAINIAGFSWSPVSLKYPRWKGLYNEKNQYLYVNIGLGYIGFPGRVGTDPEITVFELKCKKD